MDPTDPAAQVLLSLGELMSREVDLDVLLAEVMDRVATLLDADRGTLYLLDGARGELFSRAAHLPELPQIRLRLGQGAAGHCAAHDVVVNLPDPRGDRRFNPDIDRQTGYATHSLLAVPLRDGRGAVFGVLQALNARRGHFTSDDEARLSNVAHELAAALEHTSLPTELRRAREHPAAPVAYSFNHIIGESPAMRELYRLIRKAAPTEATVLIHGESGSGKELFARAVHVNSPRRHGPFVKVDCAALPAGLIENELFGHERGAFTGAAQRAAGKCEVASGGTLFLDELGELPLAVQGKLLRLLQDRQFERLGGTQTQVADVRIVAATHRRLDRMVSEGTFRQDLYYRIRVVELSLPPLRERGAEDILRLAHHFVAAAARKHGLPTVPGLSGDAQDRLRRYRWPGNVRELENCLESAVVLCDGEVGPQHLPLPAAERAHPVSEVSEEGSETLGTAHDADLSLEAVERRHILQVLERCEFNRTAAAQVLRIGRNTLARKLRRYGLEP